VAMVFGAGVGNSVTVNSMSLDWWNTNRFSLLTAWVYPTTLTATRSVARAGTVTGVTIDTTTSSLRFTGDTATTDGVWTFPMGLAVNTWTFVAVAVNCGAAATVTVKAWSGTPSVAPAEQTVTTSVAPVGAYVASSTNFTIGNTTSGSATSWQGQIGAVTFFVDNATTTAPLLGGFADGTIPQGTADHLLRNFVTPLWNGEVNRFNGHGRTHSLPLSGRPGFQVHAPLESAITPTMMYRPTGLVRNVVTGATLGANNPRSSLLLEHQMRHPKGLGGGIPARG
jgi:hypothetical protein